MFFYFKNGKNTSLTVHKICAVDRQSAVSGTQFTGDSRSLKSKNFSLEDSAHSCGP